MTQRSNLRPSVLLTIVIPTFNRSNSLLKVLRSLSIQSGISTNQFEVLIVDDGSTDNTAVAVAEIQNQLSYPSTYIATKNQGPAAARNIGIKQAKGAIILFLGDDTIASPMLLKEHLHCHYTRFPSDNTAVLGYTPMVSPIRYRPTLIQQWLNRKQMAFQNLSHLKEASYHYFYTCNISLKKQFLLKNGLFDEEYPFAAGEDIELGYRLSLAGMKLYYSKDASADHIHAISLMQFLARYYKLGKSAAIAQQKSQIEENIIISSRSKLSPFKGIPIARIPIFSFLYLASMATFFGGLLIHKIKLNRNE